MNTNAYPKKKNMRKTISTQISKRWSNTNKHGKNMKIKPNEKLHYNGTISHCMLKRIRAEEASSIQLLANLNILLADEKARQAINLKHSELKKKVLEAEEKLLKLGVKTSTFSAFRPKEEDITPDIEVTDDPRLEQLLRCEIATNSWPVREEVFRKFNVPLIQVNTKRMSN
ncbi:uncharacterized protein LOC100571200 [Acyrthosiphon pisum]|uniref:Uncharacterized protein n=1 Tax=Acyrthosiphon pisum TaxID=7029 RepID=A0A8R1W5A4_ACYPI|nr:uncharacterized protein LOC100571200 [Acyrthosiphon pisum]|eukprot:XP_003243310.1 PREDICTED: uncharacterized protein LOC100571200 [Acyrthosiphon pisum]